MRMPLALAKDQIFFGPIECRVKEANLMLVLILRMVLEALIGSVVTAIVHTVLL